MTTTSRGDAAAPLLLPTVAPPPSPALDGLAVYLDVVARAFREEGVAGSRFKIPVPGGTEAELDRWEASAFAGDDARTRRAATVRDAVAMRIWCASERAALEVAPGGVVREKLRALLAQAEERERALQRLIDAEVMAGNAGLARQLTLTRGKLQTVIADLAEQLPVERTAPRRTRLRGPAVVRVRRVVARASRAAAVTAAALVPIFVLLAIRAHGIVGRAPQFDLADFARIVPLVDARQAGDAFQGTVAREDWERLSTQERRKSGRALLDSLADRGVARITLSDPFDHPLAAFP